VSIVIRFGESVRSYDLNLSERDCGILISRDVAEGEMFSRAIGVYDSMSVAEGIPKGTVIKAGLSRLTVIAQLLRQRLIREADVLSFDYKCDWKQLPDLLERTGGPAVIVVEQKQKGFCKLVVLRVNENARSGVIATYDLRYTNQLWQGVLEKCKVTRRRAKFELPEKIASLESFLRGLDGPEIRIEFVTGG
jgi:hypothetical protein